jgi:pyruvate dehydrogenase E1 component subunit alpha
MWSKRDPIIMLRDRLIEAKTITMNDYKEMDDEVLEQIEGEVIKFAEESPEPKPEELEKYVLAENDPYVRGGAH